MENESRALVAAKPKTMMIKNLCPGLQEVGKVKIGNKGAKRTSGSGSTWQPPQKLDHFLITTLERGADGNYIVDRRLQDKFGGEQCKSIPVRLIYDDIALNFATRYICYYGKTVFCSGDGETAQRLQQDKTTYKERACPCERQDPKFAGDVVNGQVKAGQGKCKINGILSFIIDGADSVGGVWKFRTTSYNTVVGIMSSLALISRITGGRLAGIPLNMTVTPKSVQDPIQGNQQTVYVVGLTYAGNMETLRSTGYQIAMDEVKHGISMRDIEARAIQLITHAPVGSSGLGDESDIEVIEEFYPEEAAAIYSGSQQTSFTDVQQQGGQQTQQQDQPLFGTVIEHEQPGGQQQGAAAAEPASFNPATHHPSGRQRGLPPEGKKRRNAAEVEEDRLADERDAAAAQAAAAPEAATPENTNEAAVIQPACEHPDDALFTEDGKLMCGKCGNEVQEEEAPQTAQPAEPAPQVQQTQQAAPAAAPAGAMADLF